MSVLSVSGLSVRRGGGDVVSDVSLGVTSGEITALVGPNGAGKTSLLEAISGVIQPHSGSVQLDGIELTRLDRRKRARLGLIHVQQGRAIFPSLTVEESINMVSRDPETMRMTLHYFPELEKRLSSPTALLSGGEQQMVVLARAFAARPRILLIDEMSLGLAPVVVTRLLPIVNEIAESGVGVLLVEQFARLALGISSTAVVISGGRETYAGDARELRSNEGGLHRAYMGLPASTAQITGNKGE